MQALEEGGTPVAVLTTVSALGVHTDITFKCQAIFGGHYLLWSGIEYGLCFGSGQNLSDKLIRAQKEIAVLKEHDFKLSFALDCAEAINWEISEDHKKVIFSKNFDTYYGIRQSDYDYDFERFLELHLNPHKEQVLESMERYVTGKAEMMELEITLYDDKGRMHWLLARGKFISEERKVIYGVSINITKQKNLEDRLARMAYVDSNTGLYKAEYISDVLAGRIEAVKISTPGLMMLNIYRFRDINAVFGHERGTEVLVHAAKRLATLTNYLIARIEAGGFIILFNQAKGTAELEEVGRRILGAFEKPLMIGGHPYFINFKIGIAKAEGRDADFGTLLKDAELAVNHIKNDEIRSLCVISDEIRKSEDDYLNMVYEFRQAIQCNEFLLHFQPIINGVTKKVSGAEALIRWNHPKRGMISPATFIPLAEQTGLINQIGDFVLAEAMKELKKCMEIDSKFYISVNVSVIQLMSNELLQRIQGLLEDYRIPPGNLIVEITESVFIANMTQMISMLNKIRELGVRVSLDDFGTGYSSLSYLTQIPLDNLKIDQSFLRDVSDSPASEAILKSIISLARNLNLSITVEGVENAGHMELLKVYGCDYLQGYFFSRPVPSDGLESFLEGN
jgi:diguanylate cyclase (GGDEF)-like protein